MADKQLLAVAISDIHLANWKQFNPEEYRLWASYNIVTQVINIAYKWGCPILNPGDFIDHPKYMENTVMKWVAEISKDLRKKEIVWYGINGNHDLNKINSFASPQPGYMTHLAKMMPNQFKCVDFKAEHDFNQDLNIHGIPYTNHNIGFIEALKERVQVIKDLKKSDKLNAKSKNILMIHRDLAGAVEPDGKIIKKDPEGDETIKSLFKHFDLVISGHIHKPQKIKALGKNVIMLGAPNQQRRSDRDCEMGYWLIYHDMTTQFVPVDAPKFRTHAWDELPENETDFWTKLPKPMELGDTTSSNKFNVNTDKKSLVKSFFKKKKIKSKSKMKLLISLLDA